MASRALDGVSIVRSGLCKDEDVSDEPFISTADNPGVSFSSDRNELSRTSGGVPRHRSPDPSLESMDTRSHVRAYARERRGGRIGTPPTSPHGRNDRERVGVGGPSPLARRARGTWKSPETPGGAWSRGGACGRAGVALAFPQPPVSYASTVSPLRAASIAATSILFMVIIASKARLAATLSGLVVASSRTRGVICQEKLQRSLHQPQALSSPPLSTIAFQ